MSARQSYASMRGSLVKRINGNKLQNILLEGYSKPRVYTHLSSLCNNTCLYAWTVHQLWTSTTAQNSHHLRIYFGILGYNVLDEKLTDVKVLDLIANSADLLQSVPSNLRCFFHL